MTQEPTENLNNSDLLKNTEFVFKFSYYEIKRKQLQVQMYFRKKQLIITCEIRISWILIMSLYLTNTCWDIWWRNLMGMVILAWFSRKKKTLTEVYTYFFLILRSPWLCLNSHVYLTNVFPLVFLAPDLKNEWITMEPVFHCETSNIWSQFFLTLCSWDHFNPRAS